MFLFQNQFTNQLHSFLLLVGFGKVELSLPVVHGQARSSKSVTIQTDNKCFHTDPVPSSSRLMSIANKRSLVCSQQVRNGYACQSGNSSAALLICCLKGLRIFSKLNVCVYLLKVVFVWEDRIHRPTCSIQYQQQKKKLNFIFVFAVGYLYVQSCEPFQSLYK